jgi:hypothetical protein
MTEIEKVGLDISNKMLNEAIINTIANVGKAIANKLTPDSLKQGVQNIQQGFQNTKNLVALQKGLSNVLFGKGMMGNLQGVKNVNNLYKFANYFSGNMDNLISQKPTPQDQTSMSADYNGLKNKLKGISINSAQSMIDMASQNPTVKQMIKDQYKRWQSLPQNQPSGQPTQDTTKQASAQQQAGTMVQQPFSVYDELQYSGYKYIVEKIIDKK